MTAPVVADQFVKCLDLLDLNDVEKVLPGVLEVLAEIRLNALAHGLEFGVEQARYQRQAAAATGACARAVLDGPYGA